MICSGVTRDVLRAVRPPVRSSVFWSVVTALAGPTVATLALPAFGGDGPAHPCRIAAPYLDPYGR